DSVGVQRGDTFGIFAPNCTEWIEAQLAGWKLGALPVNVNHRYRAGELAELLADARAVGLVYDRALGDVVAGLDPAVRARLRVLVAVDVPGSVESPGAGPAGATTWDDIQAEHAGAARPSI